MSDLMVSQDVFDYIEKSKQDYEKKISELNFVIEKMKTDYNTKL